MTNTDTDVSTQETIRLRYTTVVENLVANQGATNLSNTVIASWSGDFVTTSATPLTIVEPIVRIIKT